MHIKSNNFQLNFDLICFVINDNCVNTISNDNIFIIDFIKVRTIQSHGFVRFVVYGTIEI